MTGSAELVGIGVDVGIDAAGAGKLAVESVDFVTVGSALVGDTVGSMTLFVLGLGVVEGLLSGVASSSMTWVMLIPHTSP